MDKNHDNSITPGEIPSYDPLRQHFTKADTNHDGKLSRDEVNNFRANGDWGSPIASPGS